MYDDRQYLVSIPLCLMTFKRLTVAPYRGMTRDTRFEFFSNPEDFHPERFEKWGKSRNHPMDPHNLVFGFGRR